MEGGLKAWARAAVDGGGAGLEAVPGTLERPEGTRHYLLAAPADDGGGRLPLVVVLHGAGASARQVMGMAFPPSPLSLLLDIAARERFVVAAPDAGAGGWHDCFASAQRVQRKDDVAFVDALIDRAIARHRVDPDRVYVIGVSRGGWMAYRIALELPHRLAAFSSVLAPMPRPGRVPSPEVPLPALIFGGTADPLIPYHGGKHPYALGFMEPVAGIEETARTWRELAGLPAEPRVERLAQRRPGRTAVTRYVWGADPCARQVALYRIEHGGHAEPSTLRRYPGFINRLVGPQNGDVEVAEAAWEFFRDKRRAGARHPEA